MPGSRSGAEESERIASYREKVASRDSTAAFAEGVLDAERPPPAGSMVFTLEGAEHQNFCDVAFWMPVRRGVGWLLFLAASRSRVWRPDVRCVLATAYRSQFALAKNRTIGSVEPHAAWSAINEYALQFLRRHVVRFRKDADNGGYVFETHPEETKPEPQPLHPGALPPDPSLPLTTPDGAFDGVPVRHWGGDAPAVAPGASRSASHSPGAGASKKTLDNAL